MTSHGALATDLGACGRCLRRSWLLTQLSGPLNCNCRADGRLIDLLALDDDDLLKALAGRRRSELRTGHGRFQSGQLARADGIAEICRHDPRYPGALLVSAAPRMLFATGGLDRLARLTALPVVAIVGTAKATDYGLEIAGDLARGLAASGVTVAGELADGIALAGLAGALEGGGAPVAVLGRGLDVAAPARSRPLLARIKRDGAAVSELPSGTPALRWAGAAATRIVASLAAATVVVEADDSARELAGAGIAHALGRTVAAVPGRVTSRASLGSHALLREGARLVRGPGDVLDLLCDAARLQPSPDRLAHLDRRLRTMLESVGAGIDTPQKLIGDGSDPGEVLQALSELELMGLLARGDGGRYVSRTAIAGRIVR
ncbi:MAG: processing protein [Solirubrobacteraceae bacterium]|nr:processing protein [Solirubrobacteraceae bacterium]